MVVYLEPKNYSLCEPKFMNGPQLLNTPQNRSSLEISTPLLPLKLGFVSTVCGNATFLAEVSMFMGMWWRLVTTAALRATQHCSNAYMIN